MTDHQYCNLKGLREACDDGDIEEIEIDEVTPKEQRINLTHTPIKSPNPKKPRQHKEKEEDNTRAAILHAVQALTRKMDEQTELLKSFDRRIEANATATRENKEEIVVLQKKVSDLQKENNQLKNECAEQAR